MYRFSHTVSKVVHKINITFINRKSEMGKKCQLWIKRGSFPFSINHVSFWTIPILHLRPQSVSIFQFQDIDRLHKYNKLCSDSFHFLRRALLRLPRLWPAYTKNLKGTDKKKKKENQTQDIKRQLTTEEESAWEKDQANGSETSMPHIASSLDSTPATLHGWFTLWDAITSMTFAFNWVTNDSFLRQRSFSSTSRSLPLPIFQ